MPMMRAATGAGARIRGADGRGASRIFHLRGERGKFFREFFRAAMRAGRVVGVGSGHEKLELALAIFADEFVKRHFFVAEGEGFEPS
jgi:hypothetical protein